jgi:AraC-like DNA-binding protein
MPVRNYFVYLPAPQSNSIWGCVATSFGFTAVSPGATYPPCRHPVDHHFNWDKGRVLQRYQIILISGGTGTFECESSPGVQTVVAGSVLLIFPGIWHRYRPSSRTGWIEHWIECQGPVFDEALRGGLIHPERSLIEAGSVPDLFDCFRRCHFLLQRGALENQDLLSTMGMHMLALLRPLGQVENRKKVIDELVELAQSFIALRCQEPLDLHTLAAELGVSYSYLRHSFTSRIGISPRQYYLNSRLQKTQDLLAKTNKPIKEIADILGFESGYHLSKQFKSRLGVSPKHWRERNVRRANCAERVPSV